MASTIVKRVPWEEAARDLLTLSSNQGTLLANASSERTRAYIVWNDAGAPMTAEEVLAEQGVPQRGQSLDGNALIVATDIQAVPRGAGGFAWMAIAQYQSLPFDPFAAENISERWDSESSDEPVDTDVEGEPILNSVGQPFDTPTTKKYSDLIMSVSRNLNVPVFPTDVFYPFENAVNSTSYRGFPAGTAMCVHISSENRVAGAFQYQRITYRVAFRNRVIDGVQKGWLSRKLNLGYRLKVTLSGGVVAYEPILEKGKNPLPITKPVMISADGTQIVPAGSPAVFIEWWDYEQKDLNALDSA